MKTFAEVRMLHVEISSRCNARCPGCNRNFHGFPHNGGYLEHDMTVAEFQQLLPPEFLAQIDEIWFNGNYGDFIMNPWGVEIVEYVQSVKNDIDIKISTNGSARNRDYWQRLGHTGVKVYYCLDGLADTHAIYRQDTVFETILENAKTFKDTGGRAFWQYTVFEHNRHQVEEARELAYWLGFEEFITRPNNRPGNPVYNRQGQKVFLIESKNSKNLPDQVSEEFIQKTFKNSKFQGPHNNIQCESIELKSLYISSTGTTVPCCYLDLPQRQDTTGCIATFDSTLQASLNLDKGARLDKQYFPKLQQSWATDPSGVCKFFCGK